MISVHTQNATTKQIIEYLDDLTSSIPEKLNFQEAMSSLEWRVKKLHSNNSTQTEIALKIWKQSKHKFKQDAACHLQNKLQIQA